MFLVSNTTFPASDNPKPSHIATLFSLTREDNFSILLSEKTMSYQFNSTIGVGVLAAIGGVWNALRPLAVKHAFVEIEGLSTHFEGFTIPQPMDLHMGLMPDGDRLDEVVRTTNDLSPDLVAITGNPTRLRPLSHDLLRSATGPDAGPEDRALPLLHHGQPRVLRGCQWMAHPLQRHGSPGSRERTSPLAGRHRQHRPAGRGVY